MDCVWGHWSPWISCSKTCGGGTTIKSRTKIKDEENGGNCSGSGSEIETCKRQPCPGKQDTPFVDF